jgi:hypothetical protein
MPVDFVVSATAVAALAASAESESAAKVKAVRRSAKAIVVLRTEFFIGRNLEKYLACRQKIPIKTDLGTVAEVKRMFELCHLQEMLEYKVDADAEEGCCGP